MYSFAFYLLLASLFFALAFAFLLLVQVLLGDKVFPVRLVPLAKGAHLFICACMTFSSAVLLSAFVNFDFSVEYVARYSDSTLPLFYRITAFWAGQAGSLLFWAWSVALSGLVFSFTPAYARLGTLTKQWHWIFFAIIMAFFLLALVVWSNPFLLLSPAPADGNGLNPLLQNPGMIFHPPLLFLGYGGFVVPGCLALAQTLSGKLHDPARGLREEESWGQASRPFIFTAWSLLTAGIILGAWWAYMELGWGGYWAWDPVENASLIPWLVASAYLHTAVIGSRRGKLQRVNVFLMALTTISAFFATYLVRTDVVQSLHAFGGSGIGAPILIFTLAFLYLALFVTVCAPMPGESRPASLVQQSSFPALLVMLVAVGYSLYMQNAYTGLVVCLFTAMLVLSVLVGRSSRPGAKQLEGLTSKEGLLVLVSWLLLALACIILVATLWPVIIDALRGIAGSLPAVVAAKLPVKAMGLEPAFYNRTCLPFFALLGVLLLACPWRKWKNSGQKGLLSGFSQPLFFLCCLGGAALAALGLFLSGFRIPLAVMAISSSLAALAGIVLLFSTNSQLLAVRSTLAAHGVHIGLLLVILGVTFSGPYQTQKILELGLQQAGNVGSYRVFLNQLYEGESIRGSGNKPNYQFLEAELLVSDEDGDALGTLSPQRRIYANFEDQPPHAEVSTLFSLGNELYATLLTVDAKGKATLAVNVNPLINWIWIGSVLMCLFPFFGLARVKRLSDVRPDDANQGSVPHAPGA